MEEAVSIEIETENTESQKEANTTNENKSQYERMVRALEIKIEEPEPSFSFTCRIKRIPDYLRKVNEQAYSPMIISIGPFHYFDKKLQTMEKFKVRYLKSFMKRADRDLENLVSTIRAMEERISCCYAETSPDMDTDEFFKVILVDAIFILELMFRNVNECWEPDDLLIADQMIFIVYDLLPQLQSPPKRQTGSEMVTLLYSATQLHEAGVKFQMNSSKCLLDITFDFKNGVLEMPCLELYDDTEALIRNVMAFEQYCFGEKIYIRDYCLLLDCLVNTTRDIDLLCDKGIIRNYLGDNKAATSLVNKLNIHVSLSGINPNHNRIFKELNAFYEKRWHKWKATLRHQYFSTPWRIASTIAAIILLVFTFIQTICSIIQIVPIV
ncbi:hypothetical protein CMV_026026 [Castanea mollissima]|uniref:Uncharacterized protein n=1 Tax=Castanea mollissima TaxID=60419 RepID=A0A8J4Q8H4_9ROSI|nr:hypothetical protein CMV_026026 [Castanea mollissima]